MKALYKSFFEPVKLVMWDMDGVLIDSLNMCIETVQKMMQEQYPQYAVISRETIISMFGLDHEAFFKQLLSTMHIDIDKTILQRLLSAYEENRQRFSYQLLPFVPQTLSYFHQIGCKQVVVSSNKASLVEQIIQATHLEKYFAAIIGFDSAEYLYPKPSPTLYQHAMQKLNMTTGESCIFEDSIAGITAAVQSQARTCAVLTSGVQQKEAQRLLGSSDAIIIHSLADLYAEQ